MILYHTTLILIYIYLSFNVIYLLVFATAGLFRKSSTYSSVEQKSKIAVLIPTYKEDAIIVDTARNAVHHNYPNDKFDVIIIADQLQESTLASLTQFPLILVKASFKNSTKARSLKYALQQLKDYYYDVAFILDADNIMEAGCLDKVNHAFFVGHEIVQLHRTAKNKNTATALLDAASEEINNHIFRKGHRALGLSSALIGSGMAFKYADFKALMTETDIEDNPGEDREIYLELLRRGKVCEYIEDGLVYDEKVQSGRILEKQRTRWISAQLQYAERFWIKEFLRTLSYNIHYFDYALQTILMPRILLIGVCVCIVITSLISFLTNRIILYPSLISWLILVIGCFSSLIISVIQHITLKEVFHSLSGLPVAFASFIKAFLKSRPNQQEFIHTPKDFTRKRVIL